MGKFNRQFYHRFYTINKTACCLNQAKILRYLPSPLGSEPTICIATTLTKLYPKKVQPIKLIEAT
ncbi:hypothetical protein [Abyssisolibacter fermentans]|uniref:hypothetical protein n=1 Tax=Abyssisolibacter fermentans TaxID=1766203 RepID=UPI0012E3EBDD|nr:hypothetical protein [Abyssisolibacter fermentans]